MSVTEESSKFLFIPGFLGWCSTGGGGGGGVLL